MKRDCGKGELIPHRYEIVYHVGMSDNKVKMPATGPNDPKFEEVLSRLIPHSHIMLYALDKQGYANCIRSVALSRAGEVSIRDRRAELAGETE